MSGVLELPALAELPDWAAWATALFVFAGALNTFIGSLGLLRLDNFFQRVHAPTLGTTLGTGSVLIGSMICFSALEGELVLREILIAFFVTVTTPVTLILLVRGTLLRSAPSEEQKPPASP
jgi:multicomponent K+:H+ antiporter subunit G